MYVTTHIGYVCVCVVEIGLDPCIGSSFSCILSCIYLPRTPRCMCHTRDFPGLFNTES
jgi:hypothetical protein